MILLFKKYYKPALSGILCAACHYFPWMFVFFWFLLNPFLYSAEKNKHSVKDFLSVAFIFSFSYYYSMFFWLNVVYKWVGWPAYLGVMLLCIYLAFTFTVLFLLARKSFNNYWTMLFGVPFIWVMIEVIQSIGPLGIASQSIGYIIPAGTQLSQIAYFLTIYGISFMVLFFNMCFMLRNKNKTRSLAAAVVMLVVTSIMIQIYPFLLNSDTSSKKIDVILIQPNIIQDKKESFKYIGEIMGVYHDLVMQLKDASADLIVFPESTLPGIYQNYEHYYKSVIKSLNGKNVAIGTNYKENNKYYNSIVFHNSRSVISDRYDKVRLVPFGEHIPFYSIVKHILPDINFFSIMHSFGAGYKKLDISGISFGNSICYETIFPDIFYAQKDAGAYLAVTDDSWYDGTIGINMHHNITAYRSIESGKEILFAANTGITCRIDRKGLSKDFIAPATRGYLQTELHSFNKKSICYILWNYLVGILIIGVVATIFISRKQ